MVRGQSLGFTLIEVTVAGAIIAILIAIAYPSYQEHVLRARRADAQQFMLDIASREEHEMLNARSYTTVIGAGGLNLTPSPDLAYRYSFGVTVNATPPPGYLITASAIGPQVRDGNLTLDNLGIKSPAGKWSK
jgi:type IV pilus assembly protein PilE